MDRSEEIRILNRANTIELSLTQHEIAKIYRLLGASEKTIDYLCPTGHSEAHHGDNLKQIAEEERLVRGVFTNDNEPENNLPLAPYAELSNQEIQIAELYSGQLWSHCQRLAKAEPPNHETARDDLLQAIEKSIRLAKPAPTAKQVLNTIFNIEEDDETPSDSKSR